ncbi:regulator of chromosome condensation 1/beta-lactamase-inhibitor protein II [Chlamydoabsidia padenii]|nr:regulator of chromosome condensation 1/beta-lactamase-inhibitor protein II [Chlamydoabsidia padenii]
MLKSIQRSIHTTKKPNQLLYGWGNTHALPLTRTPSVLTQPTLLYNQTDYALPITDTVNHIATGWGHSLLGTKNHVYGFGVDQSHQLGNQDSDRISFTLKNGDCLRGLVCGREHSHIVVGDSQDTKDTIYSMGNNMYGQLGTDENKSTRPGDLMTQQQPKAIQGYEGDRIVDIVCGMDNTVFTTDNNKIYAMGWGADGQLGQGDDQSGDRCVPSCLPLDGPIQKLSSSTDFTLALKGDGQLWVWGNSEYGQGMQGSKIDRILAPLPVTILDQVIVDIAAGGPFSVILTQDGSVYTCGYGSLGLGKEALETLTPRKVKGLGRAIRVFAATDYAAAITESGDLFTWGLNGSSGRLGLGHHQHEYVAKQVDMENNTVVDVALGTNHALALCI